MNGYDTIKEIKILYPSTKILVFTFVAELDAIVNLFNIGIHGFVGKADEKLNFSSAIIEILEHGFLKNKYYRSKQLASLDWNKYSFIGNNAFTYKEIEFIQFNIDNLSTVEIAKLWFCSEKNVEYHRKKIYTKLDITTRQELITYAKKIGYEY
jgi:DNA-binding NarL/FixJ family response regulator